MDFISQFEFETEIKDPFFEYLNEYKGRYQSELLMFFVQKDKLDLFKKFQFFFPIYYPIFVLNCIDDNSIKVRIKVEEIWRENLNFNNSVQETLTNLITFKPFKNNIQKNNIVVDQESITTTDFSFCVNRVPSPILLKYIEQKSKIFLIKKLFKF